MSGMLLGIPNPMSMRRGVRFPSSLPKPTVTFIPIPSNHVASRSGPFSNAFYFAQAETSFPSFLERRVLVEVRNNWKRKCMFGMIACNSIPRDEHTILNALAYLVPNIELLFDLELLSARQHWYHVEKLLEFLSDRLWERVRFSSWSMLIDVLEHFKSSNYHSTHVWFVPEQSHLPYLSTALTYVGLNGGAWLHLHVWLRTEKSALSRNSHDNRKVWKTFHFWKSQLRIH